MPDTGAGMSDAEWDARWAERDRKREELEARMAEQAEASRQRHARIVAKAFAEAWNEHEDNTMADALIAVDALLADGVVFARMGSCDDE